MKKQINKGMVLSLLTAVILLGGCARKEGSNSLLSSSKIHKVQTKQKLKELLKEGNTHSKITYADNWFTLEDATAIAPGAAENSGTGDSTKRDFIGTNLQDGAVDESDIIKTDGNNVYYISEGSNKLTVFSVLEDHTIVKTKVIAEQNAYLREMYLLSDYLVVVGTQADGQYWNYDNRYPYYNNGSTLYIYDVNTLDKVYSLELNYAITTTRVIDRALYIVGHKNLYWQNDNVMPEKIENNKAETLDYDDIYYFDDTLVYGMTLLGGLYLDSDPKKISYEDEGYLGAGYGQKNVYVNENNLYISDSTYYYGKTNAYTSLTVSQFALSNADAKVTYVGVGNVKGAALNQFAMDEHNGYLRLATTDNEAKWNINIAGEAIWDTYKWTITNYLYILKMDAEEGVFELVGHISEGLGKPNETIRSVRFAGDKGYIVTFLQMDPLYIIDLRDPKNPIITDGLIQPGFDSYQHPWSENSLIGLGYSATDTGILTGMKVSAYNTTSGSANELQTVNVATKFNNQNEYRDVYSEALNNHKAILVSPAHNIFGFPIYTYTYSYSQGMSRYLYHSEYVIYKIDFAKQKPISELVRISQGENLEYQDQIRRAVLIDGFVYTFANGEILTYDIANNIVSDQGISF